MKFILKNDDETTNETKPYLIRFPHELYTPLADLESFEPLTDKPILITSYQKELFTSKARTFWIVSYLPVSVIRWVVQNLDGLTHYAFCTHDRDYDGDGVLKKSHTHLLLYFENRVSASVVCSFFHTTEVKIISRSDISNEWNYLIHDSEACRKQRKFLYSPNERFSDDSHYWEFRCTSKSDNNYYVDMFLDFSKNKMTVPELISKYGYEIIRSVRNLRMLEDIYRGQLNERTRKNGVLTHDLDDIF